MKHADAMGGVDAGGGAGEWDVERAVSVPDFYRTDLGYETEKLEIRKTDILTGHPTRQDFRISGFHSPPDARSRGRGEEAILNGN